jgi:RimJ/RimL family protein N-acetyltransferase
VHTVDSVLETERLALRKLTVADAPFIFELVNTPEWIKFIGNRNVNSLGDSKKYILKTLKTPHVDYWIVTLKEGRSSIGIVTLIKRTYLDYRDIGFAFLPSFCKKGYAFEAASAVLGKALNLEGHVTILATTLRENQNSIQLLLKLGMQFLKEIRVEEEVLQIYSVSRLA